MLVATLKFRDVVAYSNFLITSSKPSAFYNSNFELKLLFICSILKTVSVAVNVSSSKWQ